MNKKAQIQSIVAFVAIIIAVILLAPIALKVINAPLDKFSTALNVTTPAAASAVDTIQTKTVNLFDYFIVSIFLVSVLTLFISAFLIDVHPVFLVFYIIGVFTMFIILPSLTDATKVIWGTSDFANETASLSLTGYILSNFWVIMLGIVFVSGIIMFAKFKSGGGQGGNFY